MNPNLAAPSYFTNQGTPPGVFNVDLEVSALVAPAGRFDEPRLSPPPAAPVRRPRSTPTKPRTSAGSAATGSRPAARPTGCSAASSTAIPRSRPTAAPTARSKTCGATRIDAAALDWIGNGDHDNGGGKEYTWWLIQKTTDLYTNPPTFIPMFTYERSVAYPHGHRNVMFAHRGVRTLPRLVGRRGAWSTSDTPMLYDYLKEHDGICASHTSATGMGTDWRDIESAVRAVRRDLPGAPPLVRVPGRAPRRRGGRASRSAAGSRWAWSGTPWRCSTGSASRPRATTSRPTSATPIALAEDATRAAILDAFRSRHCYAATDNIILDVRSGEHLMGDEFDADGPVQLKVLVHGTGPIARVDIIKDFTTRYSTEPHKEQVEFQWTDDEQRPARRPELVLRPGDPGRRRARLGQPDLGAHPGRGQLI